MKQVVGFPATGLLLFLLLLLPLPGRAAEGADTLQLRHKTFAGFTYGDGTLPPLEITQEVRGLKDNTLHATSRTKRIGGVYRTDSFQAKSGTSSSFGFTGRLFWYSDENGFTVPVVGEAAHLALDRDLVMSDAAGDLPWTINGTAHFDGRDEVIARVSPQNAYPIDLYVDKATGAYDRAVIAPGRDIEETILILKYAQPLTGKNIISQWRYADEEQTHTATVIKADPSIHDMDLHPPAQTARWTSLGAALPVKITKNRIVVNARVNGVEGTFLLDTGADGIMLSGRFARRAGLVARGHTSTFSFYGESQTDVGTAKTIELGGNTLNDAVVYFGPDQFGDREGPDGLLGFDIFAGTYVALDLEHSTLLIEDANAIDEGSQPGTHVVADLSGGSPVLPVRVANRVVVRALFDTGSPQDAWISDALIPTFGLRYFELDRADDCGRVDSISVGTFVMNDPQACQLFGPLRDAIVGLPFMKRFARITFDYPRALVTFVPMR